MNFETISYGLDDHGVLTLTLNRPDEMNALTNAMVRELVAAFDLADENDNIKAIIVTGAGRCFCAGADLSQGSATFDYAARRDEPDTDEKDFITKDGMRDPGGLVTLRIYQSLKPVIAAVNGAAVGAGASMILPMDIRLASENARFGFVFTRRGIAPDSASSWFLPRVVGINCAMDWCATGRIFTAEEAKERGLITSILSQDDLLAGANERAREIVENAAPVSVAVTRQMLWRSFEQSHPMHAHIVDSHVIYSRGASKDAAEGIASFLEKRPPSFSDKISTDMPLYYPWWDEPEFPI